VISGPTGGSLVKIGTGTLTFSGANTYTGGTTVQAGTIEMNHVNGSNLFDALGTGGVTLSGGTLRGLITGSLANDLTFSANTTSTLSAAAGTVLTLGGDPNTTGNQNTAFTMGANSVAVFGSATDSGTVRINASSQSPTVDSSSAVIVAGGTLQDLQDSLWQVLGATGSVIVNAGATINYNDAALQIIKLRLTRISASHETMYVCVSRQCTVELSFSDLVTTTTPQEITHASHTVPF